MRIAITRWAASLAVLTVASSPALSQQDALPGWSQDPPVIGSLVEFAQTESDLRVAVTRYVQDLAALGRRYPVQYSPQRHERMTAFHEAWRQSLAETDFDSLNQEGRIDYIMLRNRIDYEMEMLAIGETRAAQITPLLPFEADLRAFQEARYDRGRVEPRPAAGTMDDAARQARELTRDIETRAAAGNGLVELENASPVVAMRAAEQIEHLRLVMDDFNTFYDGYDPDYSWWAREPYAALDAALADYAEALRRHVVGIVPGEQPPIVGDPVLEAGILADLTQEMIPYSIDELIGIGEREFEWIVGELERVSNEMGFGDDWKAALEYTKELAPPPGEVPWAIFDIADYSEEFVEQDGSISMPPLSREVWRLAMQTPERQLINPFFSGGEVTRLSYPVDSMSHEHKLMSMRGNTPHFNFATVHHELIPGHHLQRFMNDRFNPHRSPLLNTPVWREGWALYWEMILWDKDFTRNDPDKMGMLFWRLHRAARIIFSLNYQLGNWTPEQAVDFLVEEVGHERANAEAEVRRTAIDAPFYQAAYMIGGLQFLSLRRELVDNGSMSEQDFHDQVMLLGPMPVELIRARLTDAPLTADYDTRWRFYDALTEG
ncbi:DUF885 domain-containing protein [Glycocaulis profundi]|nr:DUF885 domain-containing protein [Glycocaulis profundi]